MYGRGEPGKPPTRLGSGGNDVDRFEEQIADPLLRTTNLVLSEGSPVLSGAEPDCPALAAAPLPGEAAPSGVIVAIGESGTAEFESEALGALSTLGGIAAVTIRNADLQDAQRNFFTHTTDMLVAALDSHLGYHEGHGTRVARIANRIGRKLDLPDHRLERLHFAALLHDIGMLKLDAQARQMDKRKAATPTPFSATRMLKTHPPVAGARSAGPPPPRVVGRIRLPGRHLRRRDSRWKSRIIGLCDAFDTITSSHQLQRTAMTFDQAAPRDRDPRWHPVRPRPGRHLLESGSAKA